MGILRRECGGRQRSLYLHTNVYPYNTHMFQFGAVWLVLGHTSKRRYTSFCCLFKDYNHVRNTINFNIWILFDILETVLFTYNHLTIFENSLRINQTFGFSSVPFPLQCLNTLLEARPLLFGNILIAIN